MKKIVIGVAVARDDHDVSADRVSQWMEAGPSRCLLLSSAS
jgi:hypothetical protein